MCRPLFSNIISIFFLYKIKSTPKRIACVFKPNSYQHSLERTAIEAAYGETTLSYSSVSTQKEHTAHGS